MDERSAWSPPADDPPGPPWSHWAPPPAEPPRPRGVPGWAIGLICGLAGLLLGGVVGALVGGGIGAALVGPAPFPGQSYGDSVFLDRAYDLCRAGDLGACDLLYDYSEVGSEYVDFGATCGGRREPNDVLFCIEDDSVTGTADDVGTAAVVRPEA